jgi:hypothetical protein
MKPTESFVTAWPVLTLFLAITACAGHPAGSQTGTDAGAGAADAGSDGGPSWSAPITIDANAQSALDLTAVLDPSGHAAVAYFTQTAPARFQLVLARDDGTGAWTSENVAIPADASDLPSVPELTGHFGLALAFDPAGNPALAFLGGGNADLKTMGDGRWTSFVTGEPLPSSAVVMRRTAAGWTSSTVAEYSSSIVSTGYAVDDTGVVTGLWAGLAFDQTGFLHAVFRDIHFGSDESATAVSNLEYLQQDASGNKVAGELVAGGRGDPLMLAGAGTYTHAAVVKGQPVVTFALSPASTSDVQQVWFAQRTGVGQWSKVMVSSITGEDGDGPSFAVNPGGGLAIGYYDATEGDLDVAQSPDGTTWTPSTLEALGDTGHHPAIAFDPHGDVGALYGYCRAPYDPAGSCSPAQELRFRIGNGAPERVAGFVPTATALLADSRGRFFAFYKDPNGGLMLSTRSP